MAHLNMRQTWTRCGQSVGSPACLIAHLGFYLVIGTALILFNAITAPADLWFWRPLVLLGAVLSAHGVITLVRFRSEWFHPVGVTARAVWSHLAAAREALLAPAVAGIVAMPGLLSLTSAKSAPSAVSPATPPGGASAAAPAHSGPAHQTENPPSGWPTPAGPSQPTPARPTPVYSVPVVPGPAPTAPAPPAFATWPSSPAIQAPASAPTDAWPAMTAPQAPALASAQSWPAAPTTHTSTPTETRPADSFWTTKPAKPAWPALPVWSDTWPTPPGEAAPPARPAPPRRLEHDTVLIGARRTHPEYPPWEQLEDAASTWLAHRASDSDGTEPAP